MVHTSLRALGYVVGGEQAVIEALRTAVGPTGTRVMPAQSWQLCEERWVARGDIHLGHRKIRFEAIGHGQHLLWFRPTKVGSSPGVSSSRSTRCPVYPVAPSNPILRLSTALPSDGLCRVVSWPAG
jgi:hypothetical protein